jgi:hypothetical protein
MYAILLLALIAICPTASIAGEQDKIASLLAGYADFRERVLKVSEIRKSGYASDTRSMLILQEEIIQARRSVVEFMFENRKATPLRNTTDLRTSYMHYAYQAMIQMLEAEIDRNHFPPYSDVPLRLAEKYEEIWKMLDPFILAVPTVPTQ